MRLIARTYFALVSLMEDNGCSFFIEEEPATAIRAWGAYLGNDDDRIEYFIEGRSHKVRRTVLGNFVCSPKYVKKP